MYWYSGKLIQSNTIELAIDDPGLLYGATVFTTLRVYHQSLAHPFTNWQAHCDRLRYSSETFGWQLPDWEQIQQGALSLISHFPVLRITIFPNGCELIIGRHLPVDLTKKQKYGVRAWIATNHDRSLPLHKTGNYLSPWLAKLAAQQHSADEAILVDENGNWLETSTGNLWGWRDNCWWTPPLTAGILPGVARSQLLEWIQQHCRVQEEPWFADAVDTFEAIAYSNSVVEVIPIHTVIEQHGEVIQKTYDPYHSSLKLLRQLYVA
ncbi:aminotransferase class IV [Chroococcales cyanobacterium IPPAS B-1203]|uniref:aminotransferase class IV n=1 Tax=Gloeocapsopsis sp. IPPAS B-1203 TaxID=2049454 RepID=UPI000C1990D0|nr:4-amino-4-deoxychorismate lyase [Gloeocapsopsis sp. IPPAS B-1203]